MFSIFLSVLFSFSLQSYYFVFVSTFFPCFFFPSFTVICFIYFSSSVITRVLFPLSASSHGHMPSCSLLNGFVLYFLPEQTVTRLVSSWLVLFCFLSGPLSKDPLPRSFFLVVFMFLSLSRFLVTGFTVFSSGLSTSRSKPPDPLQPCGVFCVLVVRSFSPSINVTSSPYARPARISFFS